MHSMDFDGEECAQLTSGSWPHKPASGFKSTQRKTYGSSSLSGISPAQAKFSQFSAFKQRGPPSPLRGLQLPARQTSANTYKEKFVKDLPDRFKCSRCKAPPCDPMQTNGGLIYCYDCLSDIASQADPRCVVDGEPIDSAFLDRCCQREILNSDIYCEWCGLQGVLRYTNIDKHLREECPEVKATCRFKVYGCTAEAQKRQNLSDHYTQFAGHHLDLVVRQVQANDVTLLTLRNLQSSRLLQISRLSMKLDVIKAHRSSSGLNLNTRLPDQYSNMPSLSASDGRRVDTLEATAASRSAEVAKLKELFGNITHQVEQQRPCLLTNATRLHVLETSTNLGYIFFKVSDVMQQIQQTSQGLEKDGILSVPFFSHKYGYKLCCCLYVNGKGKGYGNHVSIYVMLMKGTYDQLLSWPFRQRVTFTLFEQSIHKRHITDVLPAEYYSPAFTQPVGNFNMETGCERFVSHELLFSKYHQYVKDDTMIIRVAIDTTGLRPP